MKINKQSGVAVVVEPCIYQCPDRNYQIVNRCPIFFTVCNVKKTLKGIKVTEITPMYLCRDLFCRAVIATNIYSICETSTYARAQLGKGKVYLSVGVMRGSEERLEMLNNLKPLHDLETRLGFEHASVALICDQLLIHKGDRYLSDSEYRCILELDCKWFSNSIMTSLVTGIVRAIMMNDNFIDYTSEYFLKTLSNGGTWLSDGGIYDDEYDPDEGDDQDDDDYDYEVARERSYLEFTKIMDLFIDNYSILFNKPEESLFGINLSNYSFDPHLFKYELAGKPYATLYPLHMGGLGIRWLLCTVYYGNTVIGFSELSKKLGDLYRSSL